MKSSLIERESKLTPYFLLSYLLSLKNKKIGFREPLLAFFQRKSQSLTLDAKTLFKTKLFALPRHSLKSIFLFTHLLLFPYNSL